jgi:hypothetical protein
MRHQLWHRPHSGGRIPQTLPFRWRGVFVFYFYFIIVAKFGGWIRVFLVRSPLALVARATAQNIFALRWTHCVVRARRRGPLRGAGACGAGEWSLKSADVIPILGNHLQDHLGAESYRFSASAKRDLTDSDSSRHSYPSGAVASSAFDKFLAQFLRLFVAL